MFEYSLEYSLETRVESGSTPLDTALTAPLNERAPRYAGDVYPIS